VRDPEVAAQERAGRRWSETRERRLGRYFFSPFWDRPVGHWVHAQGKGGGDVAIPRGTGARRGRDPVVGLPERQAEGAAVMLVDAGLFLFHAAIIVACRIAAPFISAWYWVRGER
jgi:hypothetical protein